MWLPLAGITGCGAEADQAQIESVHAWPSAGSAGLPSQDPGLPLAQTLLVSKTASLLSWT